MRLNKAALAGALSILSAAVASPAFADRIDGSWCSGSKALSIEGPTIVTPGGTTIKGNYGRHDFVYTIPTSEPGAGETVDLRLLNEENVQVKFGSAAPEVWHRCRPTS